MIDYEDQGKNEPIGQLAFELDRFKDQSKYKDWFNLVDNYGHIGRGRIQLEIQWIHSKVEIKKFKIIYIFKLF